MQLILISDYNLAKEVFDKEDIVNKLKGKTEE